MNIYPAIDLRHGKVVRLKYGDPNQQTTYSDDPIETARRWAEAGATVDSRGQPRRGVWR